MNIMLDICVTCGSKEIAETSIDRTVNVGRYEVQILDDRVMKCSSCGEEFQTGPQAKEFDRKLVAARRKVEGVLSGDEIRRIRLSLGLSQVEFESALGIGAKTVVRWESNLTIQSKAIDDVIRLVAFDPDNLRYLMLVRNAARAELVDKKVASKVAAQGDELRVAIHDGIERSNVEAIDTEHVIDAIFAAITEYKEEKLARNVQEKRATA